MKYLDYNEKRQHGTPDFPIKLYFTREGTYRYYMDPHWHKEFEIMRIISGEFDIYLNNIHYHLKTGDIIFINCKYLHRGTPHNCEYETILCDLDMMTKKNYKIYSLYMDPIISSHSAISPMLYPQDTEIYNKVLELFSHLRNQSPFYELATMSALFDIFEALYRNNKIEKITTPKKSFIQANTIAQLIRWIDNNHTEHITLKSLAEKTDMTPNYLCKIFKEYTGKTPTEYINTARIENACREIRQGTKSITQIALDNGFNDISYFCKVFKKYKGISAKKYK